MEPVRVSRGVGSGQLTEPASDKFTFSCTRCGNCCRGEPGMVWMAQPDVGRAARHLGMDRDAFYEQYVRVVDRRLSLREYSNGDCVMWNREVGCRIYPVRPRQCVTFPYWPEILEDDGVLQEVADGCPGIALRIPLP